MLASGDYVTPRLNDLKYFEKPPLQYWVTAVVFRIFEPDEWSARRLALRHRLHPRARVRGALVAMARTGCGTDRGSGARRVPGASCSARRSSRSTWASPSFIRWRCSRSSAPIGRTRRPRPGHGRWRWSGWRWHSRCSRRDWSASCCPDSRSSSTPRSSATCRSSGASSPARDRAVPGDHAAVVHPRAARESGVLRSLLRAGALSPLSRAGSPPPGSVVVFPAHRGARPPALDGRAAGRDARMRGTRRARARSGSSACCWSGPSS